MDRLEFERQLNEEGMGERGGREEKSGQEWREVRRQGHQTVRTTGGEGEARAGGGGAGQVPQGGSKLNLNQRDRLMNTTAPAQVAALCCICWRLLYLLRAVAALYLLVCAAFSPSSSCAPSPTPHSAPSPRSDATA